MKLSSIKTAIAFIGLSFAASSFGSVVDDFNEIVDQKEQNIHELRAQQLSDCGNSDFSDIQQVLLCQQMMNEYNFVLGLSQSLTDTISDELKKVVDKFSDVRTDRSLLTKSFGEAFVDPSENDGSIMNILSKNHDSYSIQDLSLNSVTQLDLQEIVGSSMAPMPQTSDLMSVSMSNMAPVQTSPFAFVSIVFFLIMKSRRRRLPLKVKHMSETLSVVR